MNWRLAAAAPTSHSVVSLCSCFGLYSADPPAARTVTAWLHHHGALGYPVSWRRGLCWVRRIPPFPRKAAPSAALLQDVPERKHLSLTDFPLLGDEVSEARRPLSPSLSHIASEPALPADPLAGECNSASESTFTLHSNAVSDISGISANVVSFFPQTGPSLLDKTSGTSSDLLSTKSESTTPKSSRMLNSNHAAINVHKHKRMHWFPYLDQFNVKDKLLSSTQIMDMLGPFMLQERKDRIKRVVANRTYTVCPVVEGLLDLGNISAVFRSADALGFQSVCVISNESQKRYKKNRRISMGSEKWLDAELFQATGDCFEELRSRGYRIAAASLSENSVRIHDMDWTLPTAVVFGNEYQGVSMEALEMVDFNCYIPMEGMVDSFNVSVAAGIVMHHAVNDRKARMGKHGDLAEEEQKILSADFYLRHSSKSLSVIDRLLQIKQEEKKCDLRSVLRGDLELDIELPEHLKLDMDKVCSEFCAS